MLEATEFFADTADADQRSGVIDDALRSLRIGGSLLLRETYAPPWSIAIPDAERLGTLLGVNSGVRVVAFHLVEFGHCAIKPEGAHEVLLTAGETVVCFGGDAHRLSQGGSSRTQSIETLLGGAGICDAPTRPGEARALRCCAAFSCCTTRSSIRSLPLCRH